MKIVVLGSNSFAGSSFVNYALTQGAEVFGVSRSPEVHPVMRSYGHHEKLSQFRFMQADINKDFSKVINEIHHLAPDFVCDFAGQGMVAQSWEAPAQWYQTNIVAKVKLHDELRKIPSLKKFLRISTPEVYGSMDDMSDESSALNPSTPYAVSHAAQDMSLQCFFKQYDFPVVFTRTSNFYGPHQQLFRIIPRSFIYGRTGQRLPLHGGGTSVRNFVHANDFCRAMWLCLIEATPGSTYHIASDEYVSIRELVVKAAELLELQFEQLAEVTEDRPGKDKAYRLNTNKLRSELGWTPQVSLEEGMKETLNWVDNNLETIKTLPLEYIHKE